MLKLYLTMHCRCSFKTLNFLKVFVLVTETRIQTFVQAIGENCSQMQSLNLGWCENVSDDGVMSLSYGCPDLRTLDLCGCVLITGKV